MNINLDGLWKFIKEWSVGRMIALLALINLLISTLSKCSYSITIYLVLIASFLEIFELSHNKLSEMTWKWQKCFYGAAMLLAVFGLGIILWLARSWLCSNRF